jgi:hypothetical protein
MDSPAPVNLAALKGILANAKKVMNKVEEKSPKSTKQPMKESYDDGYSTQPMYNEMDEREPVYENFKPSTPSNMQPQMYTAEQVMASKLPDVVKQAMLKNPIPQLQGPPSKFSLEDLSDLVDKPQRKTQPLRESIGNHQQSMSIDPNMLKSMIKEAVAEYFKESYEKRVTEEAIKKTINVLIKEGKINTKK